MNRRILHRPAVLAAVLATCVAMLPAANAAAPASTEDRAQLEKQLAEARERLDDAARDVAKLSGQLYGGDEGYAYGFMHGKPRGAMLGINIDDAKGRTDGVEVVGVSPGGPAERAGLRTGDVILSVDGKALRGGGDRSPEAQLVEFMRTVQPGQVVKVEFERAGKRQAVDVTPTRPEPPMARILRDRMMIPLPEGLEMPDFEGMLAPGRAFRSLELVPITPKLGQYFGTDKGLLVVRAPADPAFRLEEGDVLYTIDGRTPESPGHAFRILRSYQPGEKVKIGVLRNRKRIDLDVVVPAPDAMGAPAMRPRPPVPPQPPAPAKAGPA